MTDSHRFLLSAGSWLGSGTIQFSLSPDTLKYYTRWTIEKMENGLIQCRQVVEIEGGLDQMTNQLFLSSIGSDRFDIRLENQTVGKVNGKGLIDEQRVAWEYRGTEQSFEGYEVYEIQEDGTYTMKAEYCSDDESRTMIEGKIWYEEAVT